MFRVGIAADKAEDADGLAPIKDDNAVWHNSRRNRLKVFMGVQYQFSIKRSASSAAASAAWARTAARSPLKRCSRTRVVFPSEALT